MPIILPSVLSDGPTLRNMVRELTERKGELIMCYPDGAGTTLTVVDSKLNQYLPADVAQINAWVYGAEDSVAQNNGIERRARGWTASTSTLTMHNPGFPAAPASVGTYEIHLRTQRVRKVRALNEACGQLFLSWYRQAMDDTTVTVINQWKYQLPAGVAWSTIDRIEIQATTTDGLIGYPYINATRYDVRPYMLVDTEGNESWFLQFGTMPPPDRIVRVFGSAYALEMTGDDDKLYLGGKWRQAALSWIYDYAEYKLAQWEGNRQPAGQADRYRIMSLDRLNAAKTALLKQAPAPPPRPIIIPGHGDAEAFPSYQGAEWLGSFANQH